MTALGTEAWQAGRPPRGRGSGHYLKDEAGWTVSQAGKGRAHRFILSLHSLPVRWSWGTCSPRDLPPTCDQHQLGAPTGDVIPIRFGSPSHGGGHGAGPQEPTCVQCDGTTGDEAPVGRIQPAGHGNDCHQSGKVWVWTVGAGWGWGHSEAECLPPAGGCSPPSR